MQITLNPTVYKVPSKPASCGIIQILDGYIGNGGQYSVLHEGCHCAGFTLPVCKAMCDNDDLCKGYYDVAEGYEVSSGCRVATTSNCYSGCIKTNPGNVGDLIQDQGYGEMFLGCYIRTIDASGKILFVRTDDILTKIKCYIDMF